jgi:hypothetical protein
MVRYTYAMVEVSTLKSIMHAAEGNFMMGGMGTSVPPRREHVIMAAT